MACGPGKGLEKLNEAQVAAQEALADLQGGIDSGIADLKGKLEAVTGEIMGSLKEMMPKIELPEIPSLNIQLPELELPEIPQVESLQNNIAEFINKINDPVALLRLGGISGVEKEIQAIKDKFGDSVPNLDQLIADARSGKIDLENLCKAVPNVEKAPDSEKTVEKGTPTTAPEVDAEPVEEPAPVPEVKVDLGEETIENTTTLSERDPITAIDEIAPGGRKWLIVSRKDSDGVIRTNASINGRLSSQGREPIDIKIERSETLPEPDKTAVLNILYKHKADLGG